MAQGSGIGAGPIIGVVVGVVLAVLAGVGLASAGSSNKAPASQDYVIYGNK